MAENQGEWKPKDIDEEIEKYVSIVAMDGAGETQLRETRKAMYAAASAMFAIMTGYLSEMPENVALVEMSRISGVLEAKAKYYLEGGE